MQESSCSRRELFSDTQHAMVQPNKSGSCSGTLQNTHNHRHNHGQRRRKWPPNAPNEASSPATTHFTDGGQPPKQAVIIFGGVRGCMAIKALHFSGNDTSPQHWSVLRAIYPLTPPKIITTCLGGVPPSSDDGGAGRKASCGAQGGHFCRRRPWSVVVEMVIVGHWLVTSYFLIPM